MGEEDDSSLGDFVEDPSAIAPATAAARALLTEAIEEALEELNDRERAVVRLRFGLDDGQVRTLEEVGKEFGVTASASARSSRRRWRSCGTRPARSVCATTSKSPERAEPTPLACAPDGAVAQWSEQGTHNPSVEGSIPSGPTKNAAAQGGGVSRHPRGGGIVVVAPGVVTGVGLLGQVPNQSPTPSVQTSHQLGHRSLLGGRSVRESSMTAGTPRRCIFSPRVQRPRPVIRSAPWTLSSSTTRSHPHSRPPRSASSSRPTCCRRCAPHAASCSRACRSRTRSNAPTTS